MRTSEVYGKFLPPGLIVDHANTVEKIHKESLAFLNKIEEEMWGE